ncbi:MAG: ABC transporter permease, partial [Acidobacteriota bacterium]
RARTLAALLGVVFAITLLFMQAGFYQACRDSAVRVHGLLDYDLLLTSPSYAFIVASGRIPRERLAQAEAFDGVRAAVPVRVGGRLWRNPQTGNSSELLLLGVEPSDRPFVHAGVGAQLHRLSEADRVLFDTSAHPSLGENPTGTWSEMLGRRLQVVGHFEWGAGFISDGMAITGVESFERIFDLPRTHTEIALVQLDDGARLDDVADRLGAGLPADVRVWTRAEIEARDRRFFLQERPIGLMFTSGVVLAVAVGGVILFQILASEVTARRSELATLQALGYSRNAVYRVVFEQGLLYTAFAFVPASVTAAGLFVVTGHIARLPMRLGPTLLILVFSLSLL